MASTLAPRILAFEANGTISKGKAVKFVTSDASKVVQATAVNGLNFGIAQHDAVAGEIIEVAVVGGGAKALAQATIAAGEMLISHTDGALKPASAETDRVIAIAMDDAAAGDIFDVIVIASQGIAA